MKVDTIQILMNRFTLSGDTIQDKLNRFIYLEKQFDQQGGSFLCKNDMQDTKESQDTMRHSLLGALT